MALPLQFPNQTRSNSFRFKHQGYCLLCVFRNYKDQKFHKFCRLCYNFWTIYDGFSFFLSTQGKQITLRQTFRKSPILNAGPTEKFLIVDHPKEDHNEPEFKHQIISRNPGPTEKVLYNKRCIHISGLRINIIALILELLEILSEVIVGSICGPLSRIEKQAISENWTY